jgi:hypothetical protein
MLIKSFTILIFASIIVSCTNGILSSSPNSQNLCTGNALTSSPFALGTGTSQDPFIICTPTQMNAIGANSLNWSQSFALGRDIDLSSFSGTQFNIIGNAGTVFSGSFYGHGFTISNFNYATNNSNYVGLFGYVTGKIGGIKLSNPSVSVAVTGNYAGALIGYLNGGTVSDCKVVAGSVLGFGNVGGLVGGMDLSATGSDLYASGTVSNSGGNSVGGLVGLVTGAGTNLSRTSSSVNVSSTGSDTGGLVGTLTSNASISFSTSYSIVNSTTGSNVGGFAGSVSSNSSISQSFSAGSATSVSGNNVGGFAGIINFSSTVSSCYSTASVSSSTGSAIGGLAGVVYASSSISNSYASGNVLAATSMNVGGLVGAFASSDPSTLFQSFATGNVSGSSNVGGLVGYVSQLTAGGSISQCYATGIVNAASNYAGGLIGFINTAAGGGTLTNSYARGSVTGASFVGGLIGSVTSSAFPVSYSYSSGIVSSGGTKGGLVGSDPFTAGYAACYFDSTASPFVANGSGATAGMTGTSTANMQLSSTFSGAGWAPAAWNLSSGNYLKLSFQP